MKIVAVLQMIARVHALSPASSVWETCAMHLIEEYKPLSVSFICKSERYCPANNFYQKLQVPSQTIFRVDTHELPFFHFRDMVFLVDESLFGWSEEAVEKYRHNGNNDFKIVVVAKKNDFEEDSKSMGYLFDAMWLSGIVQCAVLLVDDSSSDLYTYIPFKDATSCEDTTPVLIGNCSSGFGDTFDLENKVRNLNKCPLTIAIFDEDPFRNHAVFGHSSLLTKELFYRMNATLKHVKSLTGVGAICGPGEQTGVRGMVYNGTTHMAFSAFSCKECSTLWYIGIGYTACVSWCTPILSRSDYVFYFLLNQLEPEVWLALAFSILVVSVSTAVLCAASHEDWTFNDTYKLALFIYGQPPPSNPRAIPVRMVVVAWLFTCLVMRAAYEGEMKSQSSAAQLDTYIIHTAEELAHSDLILCATDSIAQIYKASTNPTAQKIAQKVKVCNGSMIDNMRLAARQKDRALLLSTEFCQSADAELSTDRSVLYPRTGGCFATLQVNPIITLPGSPFKYRFRSILYRMVQADLYTKWSGLKPPRKAVGSVRSFSIDHLLPALFVLGVGCVSGFLIFIAERTFFRWSHWKPVSGARPFYIVKFVVFNQFSYHIITATTLELKVLLNKNRSKTNVKCNVYVNRICIALPGSKEDQSLDQTKYEKADIILIILLSVVMEMITVLQLIARVHTLAPVLSPWEACALRLIKEHQPVSVSFICESDQLCPVNNFYRKLQIPSQTILGLESHELPFFHRRDMVFLVNENLVTWNSQAVEKYRLRGTNDFRIVILAKKENVDDDLKSMKDLFEAIWISGIVRCAVLLLNDTASQWYTYIPFKNGTSCEDPAPVLIGDCSSRIDNAFDLKFKVFNLNQCPLRIAVFDEDPYRHDNIYGHSSLIIKEILYRMNASVEYVKVSSGGVGAVCGEGEQSGARGLVYNGTAHMAVSGFNKRPCATMEYVGTSYTTCQSWCTPVLSAKDYVYSFLLNQLTPNVWIALILSMLTVSASAVLLCAVSHEHWTSNDTFKLAIVIYGQPAPSNPHTTPVRIVVAVWLLACLVVRTAYEGEMKSRSSFQLDSHIIRDAEELLNTDMKLCASPATIQIYKSIDDPLLQRIFQRATECKGSRRDLFANAAHQKDHSIFTTNLLCRAAASQLSTDKTLLYAETGGCFKTFEVVQIVTMPGSPFKFMWRMLLKRFVQAGLISKWLGIKPFAKDLGKAHAFSVGHLLPALFVLGVGFLGGFVCFVAEKTLFRWSQRKVRSTVFSCVTCQERV